jgi:hypothetical protein
VTRPAELSIALVRVSRALLSFIGLFYRALLSFIGLFYRALLARIPERLEQLPLELGDGLQSS